MFPSEDFRIHFVSTIPAFCSNAEVIVDNTVGRVRSVKVCVEPFQIEPVELGASTFQFEDVSENEILLEAAFAWSMFGIRAASNTMTRPRALVARRFKYAVKLPIAIDQLALIIITLRENSLLLWHVRHRHLCFLSYALVGKPSGAAMP